MKERFLLTGIGRAPEGSRAGDFLGAAQGKRVLRFHRSFPAYAETPLADLRSLARTLGIRRIFVKDESYRFGLNAFKVLGGSYGIGVFLANRLGLSPDRITIEKLRLAGAR